MIWYIWYATILCAFKSEWCHCTSACSKFVILLNADLQRLRYGHLTCRNITTTNPVDFSCGIFLGTEHNSGKHIVLIGKTGWCVALYACSVFYVMNPSLSTSNLSLCTRHNSNYQLYVYVSTVCQFFTTCPGKSLRKEKFRFITFHHLRDETIYTFSNYRPLMTCNTL